MRERLKSNGKTDLALPDAEYILTHLQPFRFIGDHRKEAGFHYWDTKSGRITLYDYHSIYSALRSAMVEKDVIEQFMHQILHAKEIFNPHGDYGMVLLEETNNVYQINSYVAPAWRSVVGAPAELPEEIEKLMLHLFENEECREFVYTWIYHSLTHRAGTYLYLCGGQGSGKNTLANVIAALHGAHNVSNPKQDSILGRFNHYLKNKRFVFFDEFNCRNRQDKDTLKRIINNRVQVEGKHRDQEDIDIHASYFIANNSLEAIGIDPVDRRFSVPDVTHKPIIPAYGIDFIRRLTQKLDEPDYVARLGNWILNRYDTPSWGPEDPYQKTRFEEIVMTTARSGIAETLSKVLRGEQGEYDYFEEKQAFKRVHRGQHFPSLLDWLKFFREVRRDGKPLGEVGATTFVPCDALKPGAVT
jgi:energy-coupling factor transporter ATP-binding protein EcfA2